MIETAVNTRGIPSSFMKAWKQFLEPCSTCKEALAIVVDGSGRGRCETCAACENTQREEYRGLLRRTEARRILNETRDHD
jgi:hypothetical protein